MKKKLFVSMTKSLGKVGKLWWSRNTRNRQIWKYLKCYKGLIKSMNAYKKICNNLWSSVVIFIRFAISKVPVIGYKYPWDRKISLWTYPTNNMRLIQICIVAIAKKASKQAEIRSHRTTRRRYLRWYQAKQRSCWKRGTEILRGYI